MAAPTGFLEDGYGRAYAALEPQIRAQVVAEYETRLASASFWQRIRLRREIEREIERRIHQKAPPGALY